MPGTRKLGRTTDHRTAMLRAMVTYLLENGRIETTYTRALEVRSMAEKYITLAKTDSLHSKRQAMAFITKAPAAATLPRWRLSNWSDPVFAGGEESPLPGKQCK
mgnify:CR=1 FL=1